jgi:hypothetical protein
VRSLSGKVVLDKSLKELIGILKYTLKLFAIDYILNLTRMRNVIKVLIKLALLIKKSKRFNKCKKFKCYSRLYFISDFNIVIALNCK